RAPASLFFFSTAPPTSALSTLSLHDALPIFQRSTRIARGHLCLKTKAGPSTRLRRIYQGLPWLDVRLTKRACYGEEELARKARRSEEHTSELQSRSDLVCRLLLEKKKK